MTHAVSRALIAAALAAGPVLALAQAPAVSAQTSSGFVNDATSDAARSSLGDRRYGTSPSDEDRRRAAEPGDRDRSQAQQPSSANPGGNTTGEDRTPSATDRTQPGTSDRPGG